MVLEAPTERLDVKLVPLLLLVAYAAFAAWGWAHHVLDWRVLVATGPLGVAAFAFGYTIDLLIFGVLIKKTFARKEVEKSEV
jgi:hypothetical protein